VRELKAILAKLGQERAKFELAENPTLQELRVSAETLGWIGKRKRVCHD